MQVYCRCRCTAGAGAGAGAITCAGVGASVAQMQEKVHVQVQEQIKVQYLDHSRAIAIDTLLLFPMSKKSVLFPDGTWCSPNHLLG